MRKKIIILFIVALLGTTTIINANEKLKKELILGGHYLNICDLRYEKRNEEYNQKNTLERFFRPSNLPVLNDRIENSLYDMFGSENNNLTIPDKFFKTPKDTIINYFSVLREAANPTNQTKTGCGTLGYMRGPYPVAYNFLSKEYKEKYSYNEYVDSFKNKLHINLIKLNEVPKDKKDSEGLKYFVELEVIEGTDENKGVFAYYYGYIYLTEENGTYKINNMVYSPEDYLCAPYHGWHYDAKFILDIKYKDWCSLVDGNIEIKQDGYEKKAYFKDKDKNEYYVLFYQLTNGYDIKIADYKKNKEGKWELIYIDPKKCLENKKG